MTKTTKIKAIFVDCDGVLTTGSYFYAEDGKLLKEFSSMDGKGFAQAKEKYMKLFMKLFMKKKNVFCV